MTNIWKKSLSMFLAVVMIFSMLPMNVFADEGTTCEHTYVDGLCVDCGAEEPEASEPEASEPEASEPEASEPEASESEASEPEASEPEASEPEASEPEASEPEASEPECQHEGMTAADATCGTCGAENPYYVEPVIEEPITGTISENMDWEDGDIVNGITIAGDVTITVKGTVTVTGTIRMSPDNISKVTFNGEDNAKLIRGGDFTGQMFYAEGAHTLTFNNITLDGGAVWTGDVDETLNRGKTNSGVKATGSVLYLVKANAILNYSTLQNHDDNGGDKATAVFLREYASVVFKNAIVRNNNSTDTYYRGGVITTRYGGTAKTYDSEVYGNSAAQGGFFGTGSSGSYGGVCEVYNTKFHNNFATNGALFDMQCNSNKGYLLIDGCEFYNNASNRGLIYEYAYSRPVIIKDSYFHDNECAVWDCHADPILDLSGKIVIEEDPDYTGYLFETPIVLSAPLAEGSVIAMSEASITKLGSTLITGTKDYAVTEADLAKFDLPADYQLFVVDVNSDGFGDVFAVKPEGEVTEITITLKDSMNAEASVTGTVFSAIACLPVNPFSHEGYTFAGWVDADGNAVAKQKFTEDEDTTLTATWKLETPVLKLSRDNATLKVAVNNKYDNLTYTYKWYKDNVAIEGATAETYTMTDINSATYKCEVTAAGGICKPVTVSASGTFSAPAAAQVGETKYGSLKAAIEAANAVEGGATVTLMQNVTLDDMLTITGDVTISGAYTITRADNYTKTLFTVNAGATLTLDGGLVIDGGNNYAFDEDAYMEDAETRVKVAKEDSAKWFTPAEGAPVATAFMITTSGGIINLNDVTIQNNYSISSGVISAGANSTITLTGAKITHVASVQGNGVVANIDGKNINVTMNEGTVVDGNHVGGNHGIFKVYSGATLTMNGGEITNNTGWNSNGVVIGIYWGSFYMNGGKICSNTGVNGPNNGRNAAIYGHSGHTFVMNGGTICHNAGGYGGLDAPYDNGKTEIRGGAIIDNISYSGNSLYDVNGSSALVITGGTFTQDVSQWLAPNTGLTYDEETGTYGVVTEGLYKLYLTDPATGEPANVPYIEGNDLASLVAIGKLFYADYYEMELKVLYDVKIDESVVIDYPMTINLNSKTITGVNIYPVIRVQGDADVTVKNGTITNTDYVFVLGASDASSAGYLTIESGKYHGDITVASVTKGTLTINGGEFSVDPYEGSYEYTLNCIDANYNNRSAKIFVKGGTFANFNPANNAAEGAGTNFCPAGYEATEANNYFTVHHYIAQVGETKYESLTEAIAAAKAAGTTVTVLQTIVLTEDGTLDLQGVRLNAASSIQNAPVFRVLANVTVTNGIVDGRGPVEGEGGINCYAFIVGNSETAGTLTITSGTYRGVTTAISITNGTVNISGGVFQTGHDNEGTDYGAQYLLNCMDDAYKNGTAKFNITGGRFNGFNPENNTAEGANTNFLSGNYKACDRNGDEKWYVSKANVLVTGTKEDGTPYNGELYFTSIYDALDFIQPRDTATIKLLSDFTITADQRMANNYSFIINAEYVTLDLNGKTMLFDYEGSTATCYASFAIYNKGTLTILDSSEEQTGTIYNKTKIQGKDGPRILWVTSAGSATIKAGNFISEQGDTMFYTSNSNAEIPTTLYITGGYFKHVNPTSGDVYRYFNQQNGYQKQTIEVSGGIWAHDFRDGEMQIADDFAAQQLDDGTWGIVESVAKVVNEDGNNRYNWEFASLAEAIYAAEAGDTVTLLTDIELAASVAVADEKVITLDLNGKTISGSGTAVFQVAGELTLVDTSTKKTGEIKHTGPKASSSAISLANGTLIMESGSISSNHKAVQGGGTGAANTIIIRGGVIKGDDAALNLNKGSNTVSITGGKLVGGYAVHVAEENGEVIDEFTISGGAFEGKLPEVTKITEKKLSITGGTFTVDPSDYVADGYCATFKDGIYTVVKAVAKIGDVYYATVDAAIEAAQKGDTIVLVKDTETTALVLLKGIDLDLAGKNLSVEGYVAAFKGNSIIDSVGGGRLKVARDMMLVDATNKDLPIWDGIGGYAFANYRANNPGVGALQTKQTGDAGHERVEFVFIPNLAPDEYELIAKGTQTSGVKMKLIVHWTTEDEAGNVKENTRDFVYSKDLIATVSNSYKSNLHKYGRVFTMTLTGTEKVKSLSFEVCFESENGTKLIFN